MRRLLPALLTVLLLTGCTGSSDDESPSERDGGEGGGATSPGKTTAAPKGPDCATVWKAGKTLPADYAGCVTDGAAGEEEIVECSDGTRFVAYLDTFYARTGDRIVEPEVAPMQDTDEFSAAYTDCTGQ